MKTMKMISKWNICAPKFEFNALQKFDKQLCSLYPELFTIFSHDKLSKNNTVGGMVGLLTYPPLSLLNAVNV